MKTFVLFAGLCFGKQGVPTAYFHGMHDDCENNQQIAKVLSSDLGDLVECIEVGDGIETSIIKSFKAQAEMACDTLINHPGFQTEEINVIGFSQGGLIARYIAQACPIKGKVRNLITVGTPNMGVTEAPVCATEELHEHTALSIGCTLLNFGVQKVMYSEWLTEISPTGYYRDVDNLSEYFEKSTFLNRLNNEIIHENNDLYRQRMLSLNSASFISWDSDIIVYPRESHHFGQLTTSSGESQNMEGHGLYYKPSDFSTQPMNLELDNDTQEMMELFQQPYDGPLQLKGRRKLVKMVDSDWYQNDNLGLKTLNEANRINLLHMPGGHDKFSVSEARIMFVPALQI